MFFTSDEKNWVKVEKVNKKYSYDIKGQKILFELNGIPQAKINNNYEILDEFILKENMKTIIKTMSNGSTKYIEIPKVITMNFEENNEKENNMIFDIQESNISFDDVYIEPESKESIQNALLMITHRDKLFNEWGLSETFRNNRAMILNFYGKPGTGKSVVAKAIAKELNKKLLSVNYADLESKYVGDTPKNIKKVFEVAKENDAIIVFDEADSFLGKRIENVTASADYGVNITRSVMLMELEKYNGVVIFTTNLLKNYDSAFKRRILANIEFKMPDVEGRKYLWNLFLPSKLPLEGINIEELANKYCNITGADIKDIILLSSLNCLRENRQAISKIDLHKGYQDIKQRYIEENTFEKDVKVVDIESIDKEQLKDEI